MTKSTAYCLGLLLGLASCQILSAQRPQKISIYKLKLDEPPGVKDLEFGRTIEFKRLRGTPRLPRDFHARLFRGSVEDLKRYPDDGQGCVRFDSVLLEVRQGSTIQMRGLDHPAWLHPNGDGFLPEQYTIVFETGDQPTDSAIRIHRAELDAYFAFASSIRLVAPESLKRTVTQTVKLAENLLKNRQEDFQKITTSACWGVQAAITTPTLISSVSGGPDVAELVPCSTKLAIRGVIAESGAEALPERIEGASTGPETWADDWHL